MKRDYESGVHNEVRVFIGVEVEKTPAYGLKTLFVVGYPIIDEVTEIYYDSQCEHMYIGANKSFYLDEEILDICSSIWNKRITGILKKGILTTLDFSIKYLTWVLEQGFCDYKNFIPQISVELPNIDRLNHNAVLKIDDTDFKKSNPGVWCHSLHKLQSSETFTPWIEYGKDSIIK